MYYKKFIILYYQDVGLLTQIKTSVVMEGIVKSRPRFRSVEINFWIKYTTQALLSGAYDEWVGYIVPVVLSF